LPKGDHGVRAELEPKWGSVDGAPSGVQGKAERFLSIFVQKSGQKLTI